jgi:hypothetical protein
MLQSVIQDLFTPKDVQMNQMRMVAEKAMQESPTGQVPYHTYGVYRPSKVRQWLFGQGDEPLFPLPTGSSVKQGKKLGWPSQIHRMETSIPEGATLGKSKMELAEEEARRLYPDNIPKQTELITAKMFGIKPGAVEPPALRSQREATTEKLKKETGLLGIPKPELAGITSKRAAEEEKIRKEIPLVGQARPLPPSQVELQKAQTDLARTRKGAVGKEKKPPILPSNTKPLRDELTKIYLNEMGQRWELWGGTDADRKQRYETNKEAYQKWGEKELYQFLTSDQRSAFDRVVSVANRYVKEMGPREAIVRAMTEMEAGGAIKTSKGMGGGVTKPAPRSQSVTTEQGTYAVEVLP